MVTATVGALDACERAIEDAYTRLWRHYKPELKYLPGRDQEKLRGLAARLLENGIDPHNYVRRIFEYYANMIGTVTVGMLASSKSIEHYLEHRSERDLDIDIIIQTQMNKFNELLNNGRSIRDILTDFDLQMGALFRYAIAYSTGEHDLCGQFKEEAQHLLLFEPRYRKAFASLLPQEMVDVQFNPHFA